MPPPITVGIPTRNRTDLLKRALDSVLAQTYQDFEIFVSDNASTTDVRGVIEGFGDPRIRLYRHEASVPMATNWQRAFLTPRTKYVATLQDDDYWSADHLANAMECLEAEPRAVLYSCPIQHLDPAKLLELQLVPGYEQLDRPRAFEPRETLPIWLKRHSMQLTTTVFRRDALDGLHWGPKNTLYPLDIQIIAMAAMKGLWIYDPRCTAYYWHHSANLSSTTPRLRIKYAAQGNYAVRTVSEFAIERGCFDEERLLDEMSRWPLAQVAGIVVAYSAYNASPALRRFADRLITRFPEVLTSDATSRHCKIAGSAGRWYLGFADMLNRARAMWWPVGRQPAMPHA
jgi:hypothetical protein